MTDSPYVRSSAGYKIYTPDKIGDKVRPPDDVLIQPYYKVGQEVFAVHDGKIVCETICGYMIVVHEETRYKIFYHVHKPWFRESLLFPSKEELIKSM